MGVEKDVQTVYGTVHGQGLVICAYCGGTKGITIAGFSLGETPRRRLRLWPAVFYPY